MECGTTHISAMVEPLIDLGYLIIAGLFISSYREHKDANKNKAAVSILHLMLIFALCAITRILHYIGGEAVELGSFALHIVLLFVTYAYIFTRQANKIIGAIYGTNKPDL